jgi:hypothetical protein
MGVGEFGLEPEASSTSKVFSTEFASAMQSWKKFFKALFLEFSK